jgi:hypothetical protein
MKAVGSVIFLMLGLISLSIPIFGQSPRTDTFYLVNLSQQTKENVIKRILANYFKPTDKPKVIYIAEEGIEKQWLPFIKNIEFRLISRDEVKQKKLVFICSATYGKTRLVYTKLYSDKVIQIVNTWAIYGIFANQTLK